MSVGFPEWDRYDVYNDSTFQAYIGAISHGDGGGIAISTVLIRKRKKKRQITDFKSLGDSCFPEEEKQTDSNSNI